MFLWENKIHMIFFGVVFPEKKKLLCQEKESIVTF